jgi:hypothetical protein
MSNEEKFSKMKEYLEKLLQRNEENEDDQSQSDNDEETDQEQMLMYLLKSHLLLCKTFYSAFS